jgi:DNA-binding LytR/AlgR family response regulator
MSFLRVPDLLQQIKDDENFNVVLMDIEWDGEQKGIDFASEIFKLSPKTRVVFVTGYPERYSQQIFLQNTNLRGFISKPIDPDILQKTLVKIKDEMTFEENRKLVLKFSGTVVAVDPDDIIYIESRLHTATVHAVNGDHLCYEKLDALAKRLPGQFILTHKSFLVNMDKIQFIERERVILEKSMEVPISKSRYNELYESYFRYIRSSI